MSAAARSVLTRRARPLAVALACAVFLLASLAVAESAPSDFPHSHVGSRRIAVEATHQSQPAHFEPSKIRIDGFCGVCSSQNRQGECSRPAAQASVLPPVEASGAVSVPTVPTRRRNHLDLCRAPPRGL